MSFIKYVKDRLSKQTGEDWFSLLFGLGCLFSLLIPVLIYGSIGIVAGILWMLVYMFVFVWGLVIYAIYLDYKNYKKQYDFKIQESNEKYQQG